MTESQMMEIFLAGLQLVVTAYLIGLPIGIILRVMWQAVER